MTMQDAGVKMVIQGLGSYISGLGQMDKAQDQLGKSGEDAGARVAKGANMAETALGKIGRAAGGAVDGLGKLGLAAMGVQAVGGAVKGLGEALGLGLNSQLENTRAQLFAFTKSGEEADKILADIRKEASLTPFAFAEMAAATASLLPASKQSGVALMDLVKTAELLSALNPAEGLKGAAFSLKEALSGDFLSIVERFNLPKQRLNELKAEGVPALKAVQTALKEMGVDADLVSGLANTASGRWSTFMDTVDTLRASVSKPLFDRLSEGLASVQVFLDANQESFARAAASIGMFAGAVLDKGVAALTAILPALGAFKDTVLALATGAGFDALYSGFISVFGESTAAAIASVVDPLAHLRTDVLPQLVTAAQGLIDQGGALVKFFRDNQMAADAMASAVGAGLVIKIGAMTVALAAQIPILYAQAAAATASAIATAAAAAPFILLAAAIGGAIFVAIQIVRNWDTIAEKAGEVGSAIQEGIGSAMSFIGERLGAIPGVFDSAFQAAGAVVQAAVDGIHTFLTETIPFWAGFVAGWLSELPGIVGRLFQDAATAVSTGLGAAWTWLSTEVPTWPGAIGKFLLSTGQIVLGEFNKAKDAVIEAMGKAWEWLSTNVSTWPQKIFTFLSSLPGLIGSAISGVYDALTGPFKRAFDAIQSGWNAITGMFGAGFGAGQAAGAGQANRPRTLLPIGGDYGEMPWYDKILAVEDALTKRARDMEQASKSAEWQAILLSETLNGQLSAALGAAKDYAAQLGVSLGDLGSYLEGLQRKAAETIALGMAHDFRVAQEMDSGRRARAAADEFLKAGGTAAAMQKVLATNRMDDIFQLVFFGAINQLVKASPMVGQSLASAIMQALGLGAAEFGGEFARGGMVPGPLGAPRMILAHAGETVIPRRPDMVMLPPSSAGGARYDRSVTYNLTANYSREESVQSIRYELQTLAMLAGR